ncbi:MAG: ABC transporter substrate-binding protein [Clostridia bacterium]
MNIKKLLCASLAGAMLLMGGCTDNSSNNDTNQSEADNGGEELRKVTFVLDWTPNTNHAGLYVADALGYYKDAGIELEIVQPPEDGAEALVASGKAQFGISFQDTIAASYASDTPLPVTNVAAVINHNTSGIISRKDKGIDSFKNLEGHTYATWDSPVEQNVIKAAMEAEGGDFGKVELVSTYVTDVMAALQTDMIDSVWVYEGWDVAAAKVNGLEYNYVDFAKANPVLDYYTPTIITSNDLLESDPQLVRDFLAATQKGYEYCVENPEEAAGVLCNAVPELDSALVGESMNFLATAYVGDGDGWGYIDGDRWTAFYDWLYENGLIEKELGSFGYTNDYLPEK